MGREQLPLSGDPVPAGRPVPLLLGGLPWLLRLPGIDPVPCCPRTPSGSSHSRSAGRE
jgi:hypothetical protein